MTCAHCLSHETHCRGPRFLESAEPPYCYATDLYLHAFVCSRIGYCNFLLVGFSKIRLSTSRLNTTARIISRPRYSHISRYRSIKASGFRSARIECKVSRSSLKPKMGLLINTSQTPFDPCF